MNVMTKTNSLTKTLLAVCLMAMCWLPALADVLTGDVNDDGKVSIADVTALIDYLLSPDEMVINLENADITGEGDVTIADVTQLIDALLKGEVDDDADEHEYVDLGLSSGTLWATCNVGASSPEEYGNYFAWGETEPKDEYSWSTYKWCEGSYTTMTKYCIHTDYGYNGFTDGKRSLELEDDAAYVNWGPEWRMPSLEEEKELVKNCTWTWTTINDVKGYQVTGPNGNSIFLPAAGYCHDGSLSFAGHDGYYWTRTLTFFASYSASLMDFLEGYTHWANYLHRYYGNTVRAVRVSRS